MIKRLTAATVAAAAIGAASAFAAPRAEPWGALSETASAITGDITLSPHVAVLGKHKFHLGSPVRALSFETLTTPVKVDAYPVHPAINPLLLHGNHLCENAVRWIVVWRTPDGGLNLAAGDKVKPPTSEISSCGSFSYVRP